MRIGHGYDAHTFTTGRPLILGGVTVPHDRGLEAHSDGDAVIHALCDALLGAAGLGDIGTYFPDTDKQYENINSRILLKNVVESLTQKDYRIGNADITILAQAPKLLPYIDQMRKTLSQDMGITSDDINLKATTTEGMGFIGRKEGIAVYAVVILVEH
jgi:2-C-methyl-D-erythritol 2,4-cyclodiphosphate synthase